jgi:NAD(P)-dependent dehydrogenase (short-subunit alcohol dehydrogenase family)
MPNMAIVTGAASGMGRATAEVLAEAGWHVLAFDLSHAGTHSAASIEYVTVDVTDRASVHNAVVDHHRADTPISLVANVAGVYPPTTLADFDDLRYRAIFDVNVLGVLNVAAEAVRHMPRGSAIVNFASVDAFTVSAGQLLYGASKAAVVILTKSMSLELADRGIRVNAIAPGWVDTPGNKATGRMEQASATIPLGRVAQPREIARWVQILAGPDAGFMTGETVVLSGGDVIR